MSYFQIGKSEALKIFTNWEFIAYKSFEVKENLTCKDLNDKITSFHKSLSTSDTLKQFSLFLIIREIKHKIMLFKRKLNYFECPLQIYRKTLKDLGDEAKHREIFFLSTNINEFYPNPESEGIYGSFNNFLIVKGGKNEGGGFERAGELMKLSKKGDYHKKTFELSKTQLIYYNPKEKDKNINFIPLEHTISEPLPNFKEKYVFVIRTYDKLNSKEKSYILRAKSTMDMNGWVFSINSQAFMCSENKKLYDFGVDLNKTEKTYSEIIMEKGLKIFSNLEDFLENPRVRQKIVIKSSEKKYNKENFIYFVNLLELYFKGKNLDNKDSLYYREILFKTLQNAYNSNKNQQKFELIEDGKEATIENNEVFQDFPKEIWDSIDLKGFFKNKFENFENPSFFESFEGSLKPKIIDILRKTEGLKEILIESLGILKEVAGFQKPWLTDLSKTKDNFLNVPKTTMGKKYSSNDLTNLLNPSPKYSLAQNANYKSSVDLNN